MNIFLLLNCFHPSSAVPPSSSEHLNPLNTASCLAETNTVYLGQITTESDNFIWLTSVYRTLKWIVLAESLECMEHFLMFKQYRPQRYILSSLFIQIAPANPSKFKPEPTWCGPPRARCSCHELQSCGLLWSLSTIHSKNYAHISRFVVFCCDLILVILPYPSGLLHWHCGSQAIAPEEYG